MPTNMFFVRGFSHYAEPDDVHNGDLVSLIPDVDNQFHDGDGVAHKVVLQRNGKHIGWFPKELCGWLVEQGTTTDAEVRCVDATKGTVCVVFGSPEHMPMQGSKRK